MSDKNYRDYDSQSPLGRHLRERRKPVDATRPLDNEDKGADPFSTYWKRMHEKKRSDTIPKNEARGSGYKTRATVKAPLFAIPLGTKKKRGKDGDLSEEDLQDISQLMGGYKPQYTSVIDSEEHYTQS